MNFVRHIQSDSERFREVVSNLDPDTRVPSCPEWNAFDLAWHLTDVQWFWKTIVEEDPSDPDTLDELRPQRPSDLGATLDLFDAVSSEFLTVLADTKPDAVRWTWHDPDQTVGFIRRRQAHEALIHRVDAELAAGYPPSIDPELAVDGIDEVLRIMIGGVPDWGTFHPDGVSVGLQALEGDEWGVAFGRFTGTSPNTGTSYDLDAASIGLAAPGADATIAAPASVLDLWLWGRADSSELTIAGDAAAVDRLRSLAADATQ